MTFSENEDVMGIILNFYEWDDGDLTKKSV